jgi:hypothetical protein
MNIKFALRQIILSTPSLEILIIRLRSPLDLDDLRFILLKARKLRKFMQNVDDCLSTYRQVYEQMRDDDHESVSANVEFSHIFL